MLMIVAASWPSLLLLPETYGPVILKRRAEGLRKGKGDSNTFAPIELERKGWRQIMTVTLARPIRMFLFEAIVLFTCIHMALAFAIFYLFFEAYPIIFQGELPGLLPRLANALRRHLWHEQRHSCAGISPQ